MPVKPKIRTLTNNSVDVLNAIRNSATTNYQNYVPVATNSPESLKEIGAIIMDSPSLQNEFLSALVNRIGMVLVTSKMYDNPLAIFKRGLMEYGETIEEVFVNLAKPFEFDPVSAQTNLFQREIPDVRAAFHIMNYQKFYKSSVTPDQLRQAFLSWNGVTDLIAKIVDAMYTGANYDEFLTTKYLLARHILNGKIKPVTIPTVTSSNMKSIVSTIKGVSNKLTFMGTEYNPSGVHTHTKHEDQYILLNSQFDAVMDVEVLASAFNMDKAEFIGHRVLVDGFGELDIARLNELFADDPTYVEISEDELTALNTIPAVLVDKDYFMILDNFYQFTENYNGQGLYWNYFYHCWKTFSVSPFANAVMFIPATPSVTSITVSPSTATATKGQSLSFVANVTTEHFAPQDVDWLVDSEYASVNTSGVVTIAPDCPDGTGITVTARSVYDTNVIGVGYISVGVVAPVVKYQLSGGSVTTETRSGVPNVITGVSGLVVKLNDQAVAGLDRTKFFAVVHNSLATKAMTVDNVEYSTGEYTLSFENLDFLAGEVGAYVDITVINGTTMSDTFRINYTE